MTFKDWFFEVFPQWYQENDTNKNAQGEGLFQRYLQSFGLDLDEHVIPYIQNFLDIQDVLKCDDKFLPLIAELLGSPPSFGQDMTAEYRRLLATIIAIYKVKGTRRSFELYLNILGINLHFMQDLPKKKITYDQPGVKYDSGHIYDSTCEYCSKYYLGYIVEPGEEMDPDLTGRAERILCFLQPIQAKFGGWRKVIKLSETTGQLEDGHEVEITS